MKIAVSACLLGENCKYNGGNNYSEDVARFTEGHEVIPVCPEVLGGLPTPREPSEIVNGTVMHKDGTSVDDQFRKGAKIALKLVLDNKADLVILQSRSPSCGVNTVYDGTFSGKVIRGEGIFAKMLKDNNIPVKDVSDIHIRERRGETMKEWSIGQYNVLKNCISERSALPTLYSDAGAAESRALHEQIDGYAKTPLVSLPHLAEKWNIGGIYVKDESKRFSLNAFKGLGGSYAMFRIICDMFGLDPAKTRLKDLTDGKYKERISELEFVTCTDGNHGRGVSWAAGIFGCRAHVYMPYGTQEVRAEAIRRVGPAEVEITDLSYDDTVKLAHEKSEKNGWILIQDTSWDGYEKIPSWIIQGYLTLAAEASEELDGLGVRPTHLFLQAGVGAMAGGVLAYFASHYGAEKPVTAIVEPTVADCIYKSAETGAPYSVEGAPVTIMAGLNCGTPCKVIWPVLRDYAEFCIAGPDEMAADGMRTYAAGLNGDPVIISGESGASTLGAAQRILEDPSFADVKQAVGFTENSILLLINTEGDTDPENYRKVVGKFPDELRTR